MTIFIKTHGTFNNNFTQYLCKGESAKEDCIKVGATGSGVQFDDCSASLAHVCTTSGNNSLAKYLYVIYILIIKTSNKLLLHTQF